MSKAGALLAARILAEFKDLNTIVERAVQGWERVKTKNDDYYLGFRHVVRNVYTYHLNPEKLEALVTQVQTVFEKAKTEMAGFCKFLQNSG